MKLGDKEVSPEEIKQFVNNILSFIDSEYNDNDSVLKTKTKAKMIKLIFNKFSDYIDDERKEIYQDYLKNIS